MKKFQPKNGILFKIFKNIDYPYDIACEVKTAGVLSDVFFELKKANW